MRKHAKRGEKANAVARSESRSRVQDENGARTGPPFSELGWILALFGTAIGAGILYLPLQAGTGSLWALVLLTVVIFPLVYLSHRSVLEMLLLADGDLDYSGVAGRYLGRGLDWVLLLVFLVTFQAVLASYAIGLNTNLGEYLHQQGWTASDWSRQPFLSLGILLGFAVLYLIGQTVLLRLMSLISGLLIVALLGLSLYLIPFWDLSRFAAPVSALRLVDEMLLVLPILTFSFIFFPAMSSMVMAFKAGQRQALQPEGPQPEGLRTAGPRIEEPAIERPGIEKPAAARPGTESPRNAWSRPNGLKPASPSERDKRLNRVVLMTSALLLLFVLLFVFSCILALTPAELAAGSDANLNALTILSQKPGLSPLLAQLGTPIGLCALFTSFAGVFLAVRDALRELIHRLLAHGSSGAAGGRTATRARRWPEWLLLALVLGSAWGITIANPSIIKAFGMLIAPLVGVFIFILPVVVLVRARGFGNLLRPSQLFVLLMGVLILFSYDLGSWLQQVVS